MTDIKIGIPLHGKMSSRTFHSASFRNCLSADGFKPIYFLTADYLESFAFDSEQYFELKASEYEQYYSRHAFLRTLKSLRRFVVRTETTDLRFREEIENIIFDKPLWKIGGYIYYTDVLRRMPGLGNLLLWMESRLYVTHVHDKWIKEQELNCALTPGMANYRFEYAGQFALEAQRLNVPVFGAITNYDNVVNMGFRGFTPVCLAVWSRAMADDVIKLHGLPANRIEITGPVQYDRFKQPLSMGREDFLRSIKLDPDRKTVFFAGGVNITRYFEIYNLFIKQSKRIWSEPLNIVIRPYPHDKLLSSPGWQVLKNLFQEAGVYISAPISLDSGGDRTGELKNDLFFEEGPDELSYLLRYSDVMINYFSTISLEAAICDLPVIHVGYDLFIYGHRFHLTTAFQQRQTHNLRKLRLAASRVAKNEKELLKYISDYLNDRTLDQGARYDYAVSECGELDGQAGTRLSRMIKSRL